jgi:hypothetical protein
MGSGYDMLDASTGCAKVLGLGLIGATVLGVILYLAGAL